MDKSRKNNTKYNVLVEGVRVLKSASEATIIELCKERQLNAKALVAEDGFFINDSYKPIKEYSQFAAAVSDTTADEEESNPAPDAQCFLLLNEEKEGPYLPSQIRAMWDRGAIKADTLFFHKGLKDWRPVKRFCLNQKWNRSLSYEALLLSDLVKLQKETVAQMRTIKGILIGTLVIPVVLLLLLKVGSR